MNLLLFSDLHCDAQAARALAARAAEADILVGAGDFANGRRGLEICLPILRAAGKPIVMVAGNNESTDELRAACTGWPDAHVLHGQAVTLQGVTFFGLGGGVPVTPFGAWSYDLTEKEAATLLEPMPERCILISHSPPKGFVDRSSSGQSLGSTAVLHAITRKSPRLVVCGHIHASAGQTAQSGTTTILNAGPQGRLIAECGLRIV